MDAAKYIPLGKRGMSLEMAHSNFDVFGKASDIIKKANTETFIRIQIESMAAIERTNDPIMEGIDFIVVGPSDLSQSTGRPGDVENPELVRDISKVIKICHTRSVMPGIAVGYDLGRW